MPIVWRSSAGLRQCRVVRYCIVGCRDKCNEVCAVIKTVAYPVEFGIHYNLIRYAAVITFYVNNSK